MPVFTEVLKRVSFKYCTVYVNEVFSQAMIAVDDVSIFWSSDSCWGQKQCLKWPETVISPPHRMVESLYESHCLSLDANMKKGCLKRIGLHCISVYVTDCRRKAEGFHLPYFCFYKFYMEIPNGPQTMFLYLAINFDSCWKWQDSFHKRINLN